MIYGIGIDIVRVDRMRQVVQRWGERFLRRVFMEDEIAYCYKKKDPFLSLAARFAAKEAFIKALGLRVSATLTDIEVTNDFGGKPSIQTRGNLRTFLGKNGLLAHLSLSHERDYGIASVVIEKAEGPSI